MNVWSSFELRDWLEDELRAFQGGKDGFMPCVWENELSSFPQVIIIFLLWSFLLYKSSRKGLSQNSHENEMLF